MGICMVVLLLFSVTVKGDLFTALVDLEALVETEAVLIKGLDDYIGATEHRLSQLRRRAAGYRKVHSEAIEDVDAYLHNPINAYKLIKRLTKDWEQMESLMFDFDEEGWLENRGRLRFPSEADVLGAVTALLRLQDTYQLDTASLARGQLNGVKYSTQLTADDCFHIGRQSYNNRDHYHTVLWMSEALQRYQHEDNVKRLRFHHEDNVRRREILECLAYSSYKQGNVRSALQFNDELLRINPDHLFALSNRTVYLAGLKKGEKGKIEHPDEDFEVYQQLCRKAVSPSPQLLSQLKCRYVHRNQPFLRIGPFKEEEAYVDPRIVLYHDVIYDSEIDTIKRLALPKLQRATVANHGVTDYRIMKSAWLNDTVHPSIVRLSRRVELMTSLTLATADKLLVGNYGIGGYYEPHYDFFGGWRRKIIVSSEDRIATVLFYLSDVDQGGATVFPKLKVAVWPQKGTAVWWYNLYPSGECDFDTKHAACPVLAGSKWIATKWFDENGQEFRRPCKLHRDSRN